MEQSKGDDRENGWRLQGSRGGKKRAVSGNTWDSASVGLEAMAGWGQEGEVKDASQVPPTELGTTEGVHSGGLGRKENLIVRHVTFGEPADTRGHLLGRDTRLRPQPGHSDMGNR